MAHPKAPPITIPHHIPCSPIPRTNDKKYANTEMNRTSLITVSINDVTPFPYPGILNLQQFQMER